MARREQAVRLLFAVALAIALALPLSGCGKKARPLPPEDSTYPQHYPAGS